MPTLTPDLIGRTVRVTHGSTEVTGDLRSYLVADDGIAVSFYLPDGDWQTVDFPHDASVTVVE